MQDRLEHPRVTTALCHGCFDVLHVGHVRLLKLAKSMADKLIVSIGSDEHVQHAKGMPVNNQSWRKEMLEALSCVDEVVITEGLDVAATIETIKRVRPDFYVKGREYGGKLAPAERAAVEDFGGRVVFMDEFNKAKCSSSALREKGGERCTTTM